MGYNATVVVMLDALEAVRADKQFGRNLANAIIKHGYRDDYTTVGTQVLNSLYHNAARVVHKDHADVNHLILVGGNTGVDLGSLWLGNSKYEEQDLQVAEELAERHGYHLRKNPRRHK